MTRLALLPPDERPDDSLKAAHEQQRDAEHELDRDAADYLRLPFPTLQRLLGDWSPGEVHFGCAFSGGGKTLFTMNLELALLKLGARVYHIGLETRPALVRLHLACLKHGAYYGDVVDGTAKADPDWPTLRECLRDDVRRQAVSETFVVNDAEWLDVRGLNAALEEAASLESDLVVIDHVDHLAVSEHTPLYQASVATIRQLNTRAITLGLRVFALSQLNNDAVRGDRLAVHFPPRPEQVFMGGHKRQIATTMLGIYRPLRDDASPDELKAVRDGKAEPSTVIAPHVMGLVCMKHRNHGNREGKRETLDVVRGQLRDVPEIDRHRTDYDGQRRI